MRRYRIYLLHSTQNILSKVSEIPCGLAKPLAHPMCYCSKNLLTKTSLIHLNQLFPQCHWPFWALLLNNTHGLLVPHLLGRLWEEGTSLWLVLQSRGAPCLPFLCQCWGGFGMLYSAYEHCSPAKCEGGWLC